TEGLWEKTLSEVKKGDVVLIQFGHNDGGSIDQPPARGSVPGLGEDTKEVTKADGTKETVHTFGWYMRKFVADTRAKGATPVILNLTVRNIWKDGKVERGSGQFSTWAATIAQYGQVEFIDLTNLIADKYEQLGEEKVKTMFPKDHTHTGPEAADLNASLVVAGLKTIRNCTSCSFFSDKGKTIESAKIEKLKPRRPLPEVANPKLPSLFLVGDSTVRNGRGDGGGGQWGWGDPLFDYFDASKINVVNRAVGGLSSRSYISLGYWGDVLAKLKSSDVVLIQFGHNDGGGNREMAKVRGSFKGTGDESEEYYNVISKQTETVHTFGWYLRKYIAEIKAKGATPIICSLVPRKIWKDKKIVRNINDYAKWSEETAINEKVGFINLNELIAAEYDKLGEEKVNPLFADPHTHTSRSGAEFNAEIVVRGLNGLKKNPVKKFYSEKGKTVGK
ncbi:MAG: GDSL-type esterase/lipase family protein, partial [Acidobacteriota bacterium]